MPRRSRRQHLEAVHFGHLDVQEEKVGGRLHDAPDGRRTVAELAYHLDVRLGLEQGPQPLTGQGLVVDEDGSDGHGAGRAGIETNASTPPSATSRSSKRHPSS
jgi:hypothetical protein